MFEAIASPSRSGSVARKITSASFADFVNSPIIFFLAATTSYAGAKLSSTATPSLLFGKSIMCPIEDLISYSFPKNLPMVRALVGDSTITRFFIFLSLSFRANPLSG